MIIDSCNTFFPLSYAYILILLPIWGGEIKKKKCPAARETRHEEILIQRNVTQTEMLMKSDNIKRCTYMYIALLFFPSACEDKNKRCKLWAFNGECVKNPKYMLFNCPKSCGVCPGMHDAQEVK